MIADGEQLRYGNLRIVKGTTGKARRYHALVIDYSDRENAMKRRRETGHMYPQVFWAPTYGWTRKARQECREWIQAQQKGGSS